MAEAMTRGVLLAIAAVSALFALAAQAEEVGDFVLPSSKAAQVENCVEPTEYMRRNHFEVIRHQRDTTVYGGIRSTKHSLSGCVSCHVGYDQDEQPVDIHAEGQFCSACHDYAAVDMNCFDCHATVPKGELWNQEVAAHPAHGGLGAVPRIAAGQANARSDGQQ
jgi:hypothetical protein